MTKDKLISVIIPVYNVEAYLPRCLDSIINNTYQNLEIICSNDGSTDGSLAILRAYEKRDNRIKIITKENGGLSSARNAGLTECKGDYISFIDSDDWIHEEYFSILLSTQEKENYDIVVASYRRTNDSTVMNFIPVVTNVEELNRAAYVSSHKTKDFVWGKLYRKECLLNHFFDEKEKIEDCVYNMTLAMKHPDLRVAYVDIPLYAYYMRQNSLVSYIGADDILNVAIRFWQYAEQEKEIKMREAIYKDAVKRCFSARYYFWIHVNQSGMSQCTALAKKCLKKLSDEKWKFAALTYFPWLYRLRCIINDPTMLQYEKNVRQKRRSADRGRD